MNKHSISPAKGLDTLVSISTKINGTSITTDSVNAYRVNNSTDSVRYDLMVQATFRNIDTIYGISFTITNYLGKGTYAINPPYISATVYVNEVRHFATAGSFEITSDNEYGIIGTFNVQADSFYLTEGVFNVAQP